MNTKKAMTLMEIVVSMVILGLIMAGLANAVVSGKRYIVHSRARTAASQLGKIFLDPLQMDIRGDTWDTAANGLTAGQTFCGQAGTQNPVCNNINANLRNVDRPYTAEYNINTPFFPALPNLRRVSVTVHWQE
ncbi:MAG: type II secretion system protein [Candidatus Omnitrophica bacterium]|nr:type II secretion system protein [Candidatus Omnitrophota bacterium]